MSCNVNAFLLVPSASGPGGSALFERSVKAPHGRNECAKDPVGQKTFCPYFTELQLPKGKSVATNHIRTHAVVAVVVVGVRPGQETHSI